MLKTLVLSVMLSLALLITTVTPASAHHSGPLVRNDEAWTVDVMVRDHTWGTTYWDYVPSGGYSDRGARGVFVPSNYKIYYQSLTTGLRYTSYCPQEYRRQGYVWTGKPYMPMSDRSIIILDIYYASECYGW